ncbi:hypothetical protein XA68_12507 [Ophiocordyceps unilateralis]|uniref:Proteophosphoglycan 5 n=1 Tax=Ophiocordyceps unilateralis TaxID=268505 RepID=A0A2A9PEL0_OPHUN|nr:hypothetical protein XA68_12507 [Ophiocordyceps unilateralis]
MDSIPSHAMSMPAYRGPVSVHKAYASENDVAVLDEKRAAPQTPNKAAASSIMTDANSLRPASKQRGRKKNKNKNTQTSPDSMRHGGRQTPPYRPVYLKPAACAAFAGATFHASPAPSALPIPSFVTKTSSDTPALRDARDVVQEPSPPATDTDAPTPFRPSSAPRAHESPLDFMFRAHREEKKRNDKVRAASSGQNAHCRNVPSLQPLSQPDANSSPSFLSTPQTRPAPLKSLSNGLDISESDGVQGLAMGPAFSAPYQERIKAARSDSTRSHTQRIPEATVNDTASAEDPAEALKKFLFGTSNREQAARQGPVSTAFKHAHKPQLWKAETFPPEPSRSNDLQAMENDLRRILKIDLT